MILLFDHQAFTFQKYGGVSTLFIELFRQLDAEENINIKIPILYTENENLLAYKKPILNRLFPFLEKINFKQKIHIINIINTLYTFIYIKLITKKFIYIPTYYNPYLMPWIDSNKVVLIIHDLIHEIFRIPDKMVLEGKKFLAERSHLIIAVSQNTKNDIIKYFHVDSSKIYVMHLATNMDKVISKTIEIPYPYILFVGNRQSYKNFNLFIEAYSPISIEYNINIVCIGGGKFTEDELAKIHQLHVTHLIHYFDFETPTLKFLYTRALFFCFPSKYEGFGIPLLEAMISNCPIVTSNISSLPEVSGEAALLFNPEDIIDMREKLQLFTIDEKLRNAYIEAAQKRISQFTWKKTAHTFLQILMKNI